MTTATLESLFRILHASSCFEVRQRKRRANSLEKKLLNRFVILLQIAPFCIALSLMLLVKFLDAPKYLITVSLLALLVSYISILIHPFLLVWAHRQSIKGAVKHPFGILLRNASNTAIVDARYIPMLMVKPLEYVELLLLEVKAEKDFFERRLSLIVGSIEKVGLAPGLLAAAYSFQNVPKGQNEWITVLAYATPILYLFGAAAHFLLMRLDRHVKLLELVVARKKSAATQR